MSVVEEASPGTRKSLSKLIARRAIRVQWNVLSALFFREAEMRHGKSFSLGYIASGFEPLIIVATIGTLFTVIGRTAPYGTSLLLFLGTGIFPIYLFIHTSMRIRSPLAAGLQSFRYPIEHPLDHVLIHSILHILSSTVVAVGYFYVLYEYVDIPQAKPFDPLGAVEALGAIFLLGVSMGIFNSIVARIMPFWDVVWPAFARASLHFSGPYFVAAYLSPNIRWYFEVNPILHGVDWFRHAFYTFYPNQIDNHFFILMTGLVALTFGLLLEAGMRRYLEMKE